MPKKKVLKQVTLKEELKPSTSDDGDIDGDMLDAFYNAAEALEVCVQMLAESQELFGSYGPRMASLLHPHCEAISRFSKATLARERGAR